MHPLPHVQIRSYPFQGTHKLARASGPSLMSKYVLTHFKVLIKQPVHPLPSVQISSYPFQGTHKTVRESPP